MKYGLNRCLRTGPEVRCQHPQSRQFHSAVQAVDRSLLPAVFFEEVGVGVDINHHRPRLSIECFDAMRRVSASGPNGLLAAARTIPG